MKKRNLQLDSFRKLGLERNEKQNIKGGARAVASNFGVASFIGKNDYITWGEVDIREGICTGCLNGKRPG